MSVGWQWEDQEHFWPSVQQQHLANEVASNDSLPHAREYTDEVLAKTISFCRLGLCYIMQISCLCQCHHQLHLLWSMALILQGAVAKSSHHLSTHNGFPQQMYIQNSENCQKDPLSLVYLPLHPLLCPWLNSLALWPLAALPLGLEQDQPQGSQCGHQWVAAAACCGCHVEKSCIWMI